MRARKAVVAGHICLDVTPVFSGSRAERIGDILKPGCLVNVGEAQVRTGGTVANTGLAMKQMGVEVELIGKIGADTFGEMVRSIFREYGADGGLITNENADTSYTIVLAVPGIDRIFLHNTGANGMFSPEDIDAGKLTDVDLFHFGYPPYLKHMYQQKGKGLIKMFREVDEAGVITSLDLAAIEPGSEADQEDWVAILKGVLPYVDFFVPSIEELCYIIDREKYEWLSREAGDRALTDIISIADDIKPLVERAVELGAKNLLLKCGAPGLYYHMGGEEVFQKTQARLQCDMKSWYHCSGFEYSYRPEKVLSATGAGDTTIAGFLTALLKGYSLEQSLKIAAATGTSCVETYGALDGIVPVEKQWERIENGLEKQYLINMTRCKS